MPENFVSTAAGKSLNLVSVSLAVRHIFETARSFRDSHTIDGFFPEHDAECKAEYNRLVELAVDINNALPVHLKQVPEEFLGIEGDEVNRYQMSLVP